MKHEFVRLFFQWRHHGSQKNAISKKKNLWQTATHSQRKGTQRTQSNIENMWK